MSDQEAQGASTPSQTVYVQQAPATPGNGLATASLVLGIIALVIVFIPVLGMLAWLCAPIGLILGLVALSKPHGRGSAIAGIVCSALSLLICLGWVLFFGAIMAAAAQNTVT